MKTVLLSFAAICCMATAANAQNEVPETGVPVSTSPDENVYAPTRMDMEQGLRHSGVQTDTAIIPGDPNRMNTGTPPARGTQVQPASPTNTPGTELSVMRASV